MIDPAAGAASRTSLLITGFGPFPRMADNATGRLVPALGEAIPRLFPGVVVHTEILDTEWVAAPRRLDELVAGMAPDIALHFGVSAKARGFEVEAVGRNVRDDVADGCGERPATTSIARKGPATLHSTLPVALIVERLRARGLPAFVSRDAGGYLCNALLYHSLANGRSEPMRTRRGFVHIPAQLAAVRPGLGRWRARSPLDWAQALTGGIEIVAAALGQSTPHGAARAVAMHDWSD